MLHREDGCVKLNRKELLLYLLAKARIVKGKTRIQKLVFLLQKEKGLPLGYTFYPYQQGPLSFELIEDINSLISNGLVIERIYQTVHGPRYDYSLSKIGQKYVRSVIERNLSHREKQKVQGIINQWNIKELGKLLDYVHRKYPELKA